MKNIIISEKIKEACPETRLGVITSEVKYEKDNELLLLEIGQEIRRIENSIKLDQIAHLPVIRDTREAYLTLGKEPARYRCSAEALLRRIVQGKGLYKISNIVDIINFISILFHFSIGCYDYFQLTEPIEFDVGKEGESFQAIGRGTMNIAELPVFRDGLGAFGSPTSDSERTMITDKTEKIIIAIIDFKANNALNSAMDKTIMCLEQFAQAKNTEYLVVK